MPTLPIKDERYAALARAFGKTLKVLRRQKGLKQLAFAQDVHVTVQNVSAWETGKSLPSGRSLVLISHTVDVPISRMFAAAEKMLHLEEILARGGRVAAQQAEEMEIDD